MIYVREMIVMVVMEDVDLAITIEELAPKL
jgi:hypothetical protein